MDSYSYIARCKCGAIVSAAMDRPEHAKQIARLVSRWIRDGLTVERVSSEVVRQDFNQCQCEETTQMEEG